MKLESVLQYVDEYLSVAGHPDYSTALNGLQVEGSGDVETVVTTVDASQASIEAAIALGADLMIVHHGLFWDGLTPVTGRSYRRLKLLMDAGVALYSCHLPLDSHAEVGNCALLGRALGLTLEGRVGAYKGVDLGWWGRFAAPIDASELSRRVSDAVGGGPVHLIPGGPVEINTVGVVTGGGGSFVVEASRLGLDAFVTGEGSHHTHFDATEYGIHVLFGGHYATETFGVRAERFSLDVHFVDQPTNL